MIYDAIKSLNEFRKETKTQIRDLNNTITRFMQVVGQRMEDRCDLVRHIKEPTVKTSHINNYKHQSMKIDVPHFDGIDVSGWVFKVE